MPDLLYHAFDSLLRAKVACWLVVQRSCMCRYAEPISPCPCPCAECKLAMQFKTVGPTCEQCSACNIREAHLFYTNLQLYPDAVLLLTGASIYMGN
jgi:hypothetical protein